MGVFKGLMTILDEVKDQKEVDEIVSECKRRKRENEYWKAYAKMPPGSSGVVFDEDVEDLLHEIDKASGFELEPDPWKAPTTTKTKEESKPECECGLGTNEPSKRHYTYCKLYIKE